MKQWMTFGIALGLTVMAYATEASFLWQGRVLNVDGSVPTEKVTTLSFYINDSDVVPSTAYWGRQYMVTPGVDGTCEVLLSDDSGTAIETLYNLSLKEALHKAYVSSDTSKCFLLVVPKETVQVSSSSMPLGLVPRTASAVYANRAVTTGTGSKKFTISGVLRAAQVSVPNGTLTVDQASTLKAATAGGDALITDTLAMGPHTLTVNDVRGGGLPVVGMIVPYTGSIGKIPEGWVICDGENGTPDLRDRFVVGVGAEYPLGATGGEATHALTVAEIPSHNHEATYITSSDKTGWPSHGRDEGPLDDEGRTYWRYGELWVGTSSRSAGNNAPHENRPPFYVVYFIMRVR